MSTRRWQLVAHTTEVQIPNLKAAGRTLGATIGAVPTNKRVNIYIPQKKLSVAVEVLPGESGLEALNIATELARIAINMS